MTARFAISFLFALVACSSYGQDNGFADRALAYPDKLFGALDRKTAALERKMDRQTARYLQKLQRQENRLRRKLYKKDSAMARQLFEGATATYQDFSREASKLNVAKRTYSGHLDSLTTAVKFLQADTLSALRDNPRLQKTLHRYQALQNRFEASDQIRAYLQKRELLLKEQFQKLGMTKALKQFKKQVYYYQAQIKAYKEAFENPTKLEERLLSLAQSLPAFKDFFAHNSILGSMFALPGSSGYPTAVLAGLQTRAMISQSLISRFGNSAAVTRQLQQNVQSAQNQLSQLQQRISGVSSGSAGNASTDPSMPDFRPNNQKTRSFLSRIEIGTNVQSQKASYLFPVTSDLGLSLGYKLNDKSMIGLGGSCKIGWGSGWNNIRLSSQGAALRSFLEYQLKGTFYMSGGYEQIYRSEVYRLDQLRNYSPWQSSGLIGVTKKYKVSNKLKGNMQLLWDFLSYRQVPRTQAVLFRIGYSLK